MIHLRQRWNELATESGAFALLIALVALLWRDNLFLFAAMVGECLVMLRFWHDRSDLSFFLVIGGLGSLAEVVFVQCGVWRYANPTFLGIPLWFPVAFGTAGLIGNRLARTIIAIWEETRLSRTPKG